MSEIHLTIEEDAVEVAPGTTLLEAARGAGIYVPALCAHPDLPPWNGLEEWPEIFQGEERFTADPSAERPEPGCGLCMVMVEGDAEPVRACVTEAREGMRIRVEGDDLTVLRRQKLALILRDHPHACLTCAQKVGCSREPCSSDVPLPERCCSLLGKCELERVADHIGIPPDLGRYHPPALPRITHEPLFDRDYNLCIACMRCVRVCRDVRGTDVLGLVFHEGRYRVGTRAPALADAACRFCTACVEVCPTGALLDRDLMSGDRREALVACRTACPARTDVPRYVGLAAEGRFGEAAAVVRERAPLPHTLGYICFHPCEAECRRGEINEAISIRAIKRTAAERDDGAWKSAYPRPAATGKRVAVVGAGPAGLTASFFLHAAGHHVTLMDREEEVGGMLRAAIPAFRLPREALERELADLLGLGFEVRTGFELGRDGTVSSVRAEGFDALLLALGASLSKKIPLPGDELPGVFWGLEFLRQINLGSPPQLAGSCVVVGGGNVAMDAARSAWRLGADPVDVYCLESAEEMPAYEPEIEAAREEGITIHHRWGPTAITGEGDTVTGVVFRRCRSVFDGEGRFAPTYDDEEQSSHAAASVILAIGQEIDRSPLNGNGDASGGNGIFLAGDFASGPGSVIEAIASGRGAAEEIDAFLGGSGDLVLQLAPPTAVPRFLGREEGFAARERAEMPCCPIGERRGFGQVELGLDGQAASVEGGRCLRCDSRLEIRPMPLPPRPWLAFTPEEVAGVPAEPGAFQLLDAAGKVIAVVGAPDLQQALTSRLNQGESAPYFDYRLDPMYTKLESELLQLVLKQQGEMPGGAFEELDDLF